MSNKTFTDLYYSLPVGPIEKTPRRIWIDRVSETTGLSPKTVRDIIAGRRRPSEKVQKKLSELFNETTEELFPNEANIEIFKLR